MVTAGAAMDAVVETGTVVGADVVEEAEAEDTIVTMSPDAADTGTPTMIAAEAETGTTIAAGITTTGTAIVATGPAAAVRATVGAALAPGRGAPLATATVPTALPPEEAAGRKGTTIVAEAEMIADILIVAVIGVIEEIEDTTVVDMIKQVPVVG